MMDEKKEMIRLFLLEDQIILWVDMLNFSTSKPVFKKNAYFSGVFSVGFLITVRKYIFKFQMGQEKSINRRKANFRI